MSCRTYKNLILNEIISYNKETFGYDLLQPASPIDKLNNRPLPAPAKHATFRKTDKLADKQFRPVSFLTSDRKWVSHYNTTAALVL